MSVSEKVAYLRGLVEGMKLNEDDNTTKLFNAIIDTLDEIAEEIGFINDDCEELEKYVEEVDEALADVEDIVYDDDDCDCCCDDEDDSIEVTCPACGEEICIDYDAIDENGQVECPACGETLEFEIDDCDCCCDEDDD